MASSRRLPLNVAEIPLIGSIASHLDISLSYGIQEADVLVIGVKECFDEVQTDSKSLKPHQLVSIPYFENYTEVRSVLKDLVERHQFTGAEHKSVLSYVKSTVGFKDVGLIGLGLPSRSGGCILDHFNIGGEYSPATQISNISAHKIGRVLGDMLPSYTKSMSLCLQDSDISPTGLRCLIEGFLLALSPDHRFKSQKNTCSGGSPPTEFKGLNICFLKENKDGTESSNDTQRVRSLYERSLKDAVHTGCGIHLARELGNTPAAMCNPESLGRVAEDLAKRYGFGCKIFGEKECLELKMGAYLAVNQGSLYRPQFIHLTYTGKPVSSQASSVKLALIGKGICMDTGGYNIKVSEMETMKLDMSGAAAVLGCARIIGETQPSNIEVHFIVPAAENMIDSHAYHPGDILTASNGKTIEVGNTDAEGRLTLADALVYAENTIKPDYIVDCATLTGAIIVGLGCNIGAVYGTDDRFTKKVLESAKHSGTPLWPMPLYKPYRKLIDSRLADLTNTATVRYGGSITAALFLKEFVKKTPWCHIDMAGPAFDNCTKDGTGYGVTLLFELVRSLSSV